MTDFVKKDTRKFFMKKQTAIALVIANIFFFIGGIISLHAKPVACIKNSTFKFKAVPEGTVVKHDYIIQNKGDSVLTISNVKTSCGCTIAEYTKNVAPGENGTISVKANTEGYGQKLFNRQVIVRTNDPNNKSLELNILGQVDEFARITPEFITLAGAAGQPIKEAISILPEKKYPFKLISVTARSGEKIHCDFIKTENGYRVTVENRAPAAGRYYDLIYLNTDRADIPVIHIRVYGDITDNRAAELKQ